jgi:hypothetical protein
MFLGATDLDGPRCVNRERAVSAAASSRQRGVPAQSSPAGPMVLIASTAWWAFPARIAMHCAARGVAVAAITGRGHPLTKTAAVQRHFRYGAARPMRALAGAIADSKASLVVPCDDRALMHLHQLHATTSDAALRQVIENSLGGADAFCVLDDRAALAAKARDLGIDAPETLPVDSLQHLDLALDRLGLPAVLKVDGTWGGFGVAVVRTRQQAMDQFLRLSRPISFGRALKRLLVDRDAFHMLPWLEGKKPRLSLQAFVPGHPANSVSVCQDGEILSTVCALSVSVQRPLGAASVVRIIENPAMAQAAEQLARNLKLSGVFGLDFLLDDTTGIAHLVEMNARATPLCHLSFGTGRDPVGGIARLAGLSTPGFSARGEQPSVTDRDVIAYFPQAWHTAPQDRWLREGYHDVPWEDPGLLSELMRLPWPDRGVLATLRRLFQQRRPASGGLLITNRSVEKT